MTHYVNNFAKTQPLERTQNFAQCFLSAVKQGTLDCTSLINDACVTPRPADFTNPKDFYVVYNIYAINQAFNTYYNAIANANQIASENVAAIIQLLDPPKDHNVILNEVITALSAGLGLIAAENPIVDAIVKGATTAPNVVKAVFPTGTTNSQNVQLASLDQSLGQVTQGLLGSINDAMPANLKDVNNFLAFASSGQFSQLPQQTLFQDTQTLLGGLNTYVVSQSLQANNIQLVKGANGAQGTDINGLVAGGMNQAYQIQGCGKGYDPLGICDDWWYDQPNNNSYALVKTDDLQKNFNTEMESIFKQWASPQNLLTNAVVCAGQGGTTAQQGNLISATPNGLNSACLSNLTVCTWNQDDGSSNTNLYSDCTTPSGWEGDMCPNDGKMVPAGYIGPLWNSGEGACR
jgi:hypothetical protein